MEAIPGEFQHALVVVYMDRKKIRSVERKTHTERRKMSLLKDFKVRIRFEEKVMELVDIGVPNLWGHFKDGVLEACDEVCGKKMGRRCKGDSWWWNGEMKEIVSRKKEAHMAMCQNSTEENKRWYEGINYKARKAV